MVYFHLTDLKISLIYLWILTTNTLGDTIDLQEVLPNKTLINDFLKQYVKPYVQSLKGPDGDLIFRASKNTGNIKKFIEKKVLQLKTFLQDDSTSINDDKLTLEGLNETAVIEFAPQLNKNGDKETKLLREKTESFKAKIERYKKLRSKIKKALKKEEVTNKTRRLVTTTLDEMIAQMIANQCTWNDSLVPKVLRSNLNETADLTHVTNNWNEVWEKLKEEYVTPDPKGDNNQASFIIKFQNLMDMMNSDLKMLVSKYRVVCHLMDTYDNYKDKLLRVNKDKPAVDVKSTEQEILKENCNNFKICTDELKEFLYDFYVNLNESSVSAVRNYAAMFLRDVSDDGYHEKERVVGIINKTADAVESKVTKVFKRQTNKLKFDNNKNKYANIKILHQYVSKTVELVKKAIHEVIEGNLNSLREKLMQNIQKDIDVNLDVDLGNLERDVSGRVCPYFEICNGKFVVNTRRTYVDKARHNVYVQIKLDLEPNNDTTNRSDTVIKRAKLNDLRSNNTAGLRTLKVIWTRSSSNLNVTRTVPPIEPFVIRIQPHIVMNAKSNNTRKYIKPKDNLKYGKRSDLQRQKSEIKQNETLKHVLNGLLNTSIKLNEIDNVIVKKDDVKSRTPLVMYK